MSVLVVTPSVVVVDVDVGVAVVVGGDGAPITVGATVRERAPRDVDEAVYVVDSCSVATADCLIVHTLVEMRGGLFFDGGDASVCPRALLKRRADEVGVGLVSDGHRSAVAV